ncbi:MAG TPA: hypothetical protein VEC06_06530 [Paucimonas sp.]|nr:hypothetical protein [Paucimonas sp.]
MHKFVVVFAWVAAAYAIWLFAGAYFAPDACLDFGGSFDYKSWECSKDVKHEYIEMPVYLVPGFNLAATLLLIAIIISVVQRLTRRSTPTPQGVG